MQLHSFFNSSTSWRVRIALALKGLEYEYVPIDIRTDAHRGSDYLDRVNPAASVPAVATQDFRLGQSLAIIEWLDTRYPEPRLVPLDLAARVRVLELSYLIACDIHPLNNLRVLRYLQGPAGLTAAAKDAWYANWIAEGMAAVERILERYGRGPWCFGDAPTLADCCLVPQIANAQRMGCDLSAYPLALAIASHAKGHPAFDAARPARQPDFVG